VVPLIRTRPYQTMQPGERPSDFLARCHATRRHNLRAIRIQEILFMAILATVTGLPLLATLFSLAAYP
jgi:hypothetical protein